MTRKTLSALEWEIMDTLWEIGGDTCVRDVLEKAYPRGEKAYTTVQTVMNNLVDKAYLKKQKIGLVNFYTPVRRRRDSVRGEVKRFVDRVFDGSFPAMADHLIRFERLSTDDLDDLKRLIEAYETERREAPKRGDER